jgi:hypothetical protein
VLRDDARAHGAGHDAGADPLPTNAVWATVIFALNIFAFIFIGLQIRPILVARCRPERARYLLVAGAVLVTVIVRADRLAHELQRRDPLARTAASACIRRGRCCGPSVGSGW